MSNSTSVSAYRLREYCGGRRLTSLSASVRSRDILGSLDVFRTAPASPELALAKRPSPYSLRCSGAGTEKIAHRDRQTLL